MKKIILIATAVLSVSSIFAQKLTTKIPTEAQYVLTVNTPNILSKMSIDEMEQLPLVNEAVTKFVKGRKYYESFTEADKSLKIKDLGFDFNAPSYFFIQSTDSVTYFAYLIQLDNQAKFEALNDTSMKYVKNTKSLKIIANDRQVIAWNKTTALFLSSSPSYTYFDDKPSIYARYGIEIDTTDYSYNHYNFYQEQADITKIWLQEKAVDIFAKKSKKSKQATFINHLDENAAISMWSSPQNLYTQYLGVLGGLANPQTAFPGGDLVYHAYLNKDNLTVKSVLSLDDKERKSYENMFANELNPKFFNYIDANKNLSYYSYSYSVQGVLEEVPYVINNYLGASFEKWGVQESVDLLSVVLDEEAIGKVICGDGIIVLTGISNKEVTYTDYEWDENYMNKTEVTKTKDEVIPEFLYMLSTKDEASVEKIFKLSMKANDKLVQEEGYYSLELYKNAPFKLYFVLKDGIVFMCNSEQQLSDILSNKKVTPLNAELIKEISATPLKVYLDGKQIMENIPVPKEDAHNAAKSKRMLDKAKEDIGALALSQNLRDKEGLTLEAVYSFDNNSENSLKYFLQFFNDIYLIEKGDK